MENTSKTFGFLAANLGVNSVSVFAQFLDNLNLSKLAMGVQILVGLATVLHLGKQHIGKQNRNETCPYCNARLRAARRRKRVRNTHS